MRSQESPDFLLSRSPTMKPKLGIVHDPMWRWCLGQMLFLQILVWLLPFDVLSQGTWFSHLCELLSSMMPWIQKIGASYTNFPQVATSVYCLLWLTLPLQVAIVFHLFSVSGQLRTGFQEALKYPIRTPIGLAIVSVIVMIMAFTSDAVDVSRPTGWRGEFFRLMPTNLRWFAFGAGIQFLMHSFVLAFLFKYISYLIKGRNVTC